MKQIEQLNLSGWIVKSAMTQNGVYFTGRKDRYLNALTNTRPGAVPVSSKQWNQGFKEIYNPLKEPAGLAAAGTRAAWINPAVRQIDHPLWSRNTIGHEAFHARNPILGKSELLAYGYGGWRAPRNEGFQTRLASGLGGLYQYFGNKMAPKSLSWMNRPGAAITGGLSKMLTPLGKEVL